MAVPGLLHWAPLMLCNRPTIGSGINGTPCNAAHVTGATNAGLLTRAWEANRLARGPTARESQEMTMHRCTSYPCLICYPHLAYPSYVLAPVIHTPRGCICPPASEQTCKATDCPRQLGKII